MTKEADKKRMLAWLRSLPKEAPKAKAKTKAAPKAKAVPKDKAPKAKAPKAKAPKDKAPKAKAARKPLSKQEKEELVARLKRGREAARGKTKVTPKDKAAPKAAPKAKPTLKRANSKSRVAAKPKPELPKKTFKAEYKKVPRSRPANTHSSMIPTRVPKMSQKNPFHHPTDKGEIGEGRSSPFRHRLNVPKLVLTPKRNAATERLLKMLGTLNQ